MDARFPLVFVLVAALFAPSAMAQLGSGPDLALDVKAPAAPIKPQVENPSFLVSATVSCAAVARAVSPTAPQDPVQVAIDFVAPEGVTFIGPTQLPVNLPDCTPPATMATVHGAFQVSILRSAPGLQALPAVAKARLTGTPEATFPFTVTADYYSVSQVMVESKLLSCNAPCRIEVPVEVTNFGNARTQYTFAVTDAPGGKWAVELPPVLLLDSPNAHQGNATGHAVVVVHVPLGAHKASFGLTVTPAAVDDPAKVGNPMSVVFLARDSGPVSKATPGPALPLALLAIAVVLVLRRRA